jgi:hypothetical protein
MTTSEEPLSEHEAAKQMMMFCAICGESTDKSPPTALLTVRAPSGQTGIFAAHGSCVIDIFHPNARALLDAAPVITDPD